MTRGTAKGGRNVSSRGSRRKGPLGLSKKREKTRGGGGGVTGSREGEEGKRLQRGKSTFGERVFKVLPDAKYVKIRLKKKKRPSKGERWTSGRERGKLGEGGRGKSLCRVEREKRSDAERGHYNVVETRQYALRGCAGLVGRTIRGGDDRGSDMSRS